MKRNIMMAYSILGVLFALFIILAFTIPTNTSVAFWVVFTCTVIAFSSQVIIWKVAFKKDNVFRSNFLGFPIIYLGSIYLIIQILVFIVFKAIPTLPVWSAIVICVIPLGIFSVLIVSSESGRNEIGSVDTKTQKKTFYIKEIQTDIELLAAMESDITVKNALSKLGETIRFSDPMSSTELFDLECAISARVESLKHADDKMPIIDVLNSLLIERNKKCKIVK